MFICTELIEETGTHPALIFPCEDISGLPRTCSTLGKVFAYLTEL